MGKDFRNPECKPDSHFPRSLDPAWGKGSDWRKTAKFKLGKIGIASNVGPEAAKRPMYWWNPYDLLGLFLSLLGPAPQAADKNNYFLPLTAVYARWSSRIAGHAPSIFQWPDPGDGAGDWPFMFQCTWKQEGDKWRFFLGASTGGDEFIPRSTGKWRLRVQKMRFDNLYWSLHMKLFKQDAFEKEQAPEQTRAEGSGVPYGNCAETYPFAALTLEYVPLACYQCFPPIT